MSTLVDAYLDRNIGDDLFVRMLCERYPEETFEAWSDYGLPVSNFHPRKIRGLARLLSRKSLLKMAFPSSQRTVVIGGSLFMEGVSPWMDWSALKKPFYIVGANFGPYDNEEWLERHAALFGRAEDICFRDSYSGSLFEDRFRWAPDIVFGLDTGRFEKPRQKQVLISVMSRFDAGYLEMIEKLARDFQEEGFQVVFAAFCPGQKDEEIFETLRPMFPQASYEIYSPENMDHFLEQVSSSSHVIATRFHAAILGLVFGCSVIPLAYSEKLVHQLEDLGFSSMIRIGKDEESIRERIPVIRLESEKREELFRKAQEQFRALDAVLGGSRNLQA